MSRRLPSSEACGEYIGVARFSAAGASALRRQYHQLQARLDGQIWQDGTTFRQAYLIHLYQHMLERGERFHMVTTGGEYAEVDTEEDYALANQSWPQRYA